MAGWLSGHPELGVDQPAVRLAMALMLSDLGLVASYLRASTTGGLGELDRVQETLRLVRSRLEKGAADDDEKTSGS